MKLDMLPLSKSLLHSGPNQPCTLTPVSSSASGFVQPLSGPFGMSYVPSTATFRIDSPRHGRCHRFLFVRSEVFDVCAGMVRATAFRSSEKIPMRHQTAARGRAVSCSQATTASSLFPLFRGEAETLRPRNLAAQVGVAGVSPS